MAIREIVKTGTYGMVRSGQPTSPIETAKLVQTAPSSGSIILNNSEAVSVEQWESLSPAEQAYLQKFGVDAFNKEQATVSEQRAKRIEPYKVGEGYDVVAMVQAGHTPEALQTLGFSEAGIREAQEIVKAQDRPGEEVFAELQGKGDIPKEATYKSYDKTTGEVSYALPDTRSGAEIFNDLQASGQIPQNATYKDYDAKIGEVSYTQPGEVSYTQPQVDLLKYWGELTPEQQRIQINSALNKPVRGTYKAWSQLTDAEKDSVMAYYSVSYLPFQTNDVQAFKDVWDSQKQQLKAAAIGMIPVYGTIYNWDNMSTAWKAISIATDALFILPIVKAGVMALKGSVAAMRGTKIVAEVAQITKQELALSKAASAKLTAACGKTVGKAYSLMIKDEVSYLKQLAKVDTILTKGGIPSAKVAGKLVVLEQGLRKSATGFAEALYKSSKVSVFDSPEIAAKFKTWSIGTDMVANAKNVIAGLKYSQASIKELTSAVAKADKALTAAKAKYPMDATKWADLAFDLSRKQSQLYLAGVGDVNAMYKELLAARSAGKVADAAKIEAKLGKALKSMTIEDIWGKRWTGSRVATIEARPITPTKFGVPLKGAGGTRLGVSPAVMTGKAIMPFGIEGETIPSAFPEVITTTMPKVVTVSTPEIVRAVRSIGEVQGATIAEVKQATALAVNMATDALTKGMTVTDVKVSVQQSLQTELKSATQTQLKTMTKVAVRTAQKIVTKTRIVPIITLPSGKTRPMTPKEVAGAAAWKQGIIYKMTYPPYGKANIVNSRKPFPGIKTFEGVGSAYASIVRLGGKLPPTIKRDMGIMDIVITTPKSGKPQITFSRDILQQTHFTEFSRAKTRRVVPRRPKSRHLTKTVSIGR